MKKRLIISIILILIIKFNSYCQNSYYVKAKNGLLIRNSPSLSGEKIGKLLYREEIEIKENTNISLSVKDEGKIINGEWVKIKNNDRYKSIDGYVFNGFLTEEIPLEEHWSESVSNFIKCIKTRDKEKIKKYINYPLERPYPIPPIKNEEQFVSRFEFIFDESLMDAIANSDSSFDWVYGGGIGGLWMRNYGLSVSYEKGILYSKRTLSELEKKEKEKLIEDERKLIHPSLKSFIEPVIVWKLEKNLIRIDKLPKNKYRLALWPRNLTQKDKPSLILISDLSVEGSARIKSYNFQNGIHKYSCVLETFQQGRFFTYKNDEFILQEDSPEIIQN